MGAQDDNDGPQQVDLRMEWIAEKVCATLKIKPEKFNEIDEESLFPLKDFMDKNDTTEMFVSLGERDKCVVALEPNAAYKKKSCYFLKLDQEKMPNDPEACATLITHGDFSKSPLEQLSNMAHEVFLPMLLDPAKQNMWPLVIAQDVRQKCASFVSNLTRTIGLTKGNTVLPVPINDPSHFQTAPTAQVVSTMMEKNKDTLYALEGAIITWTEQIKAVLCSEPEDILAEDDCAGALKQIEFWANKAKNLGFVLEQLRTPKIEKILRLLKKVTSTYLPAFEKLQDEVDQAFNEASTILPYMKCLEPYLITIQSADDFTAVSDAFRPVYHGILLMWKNLPHFASPHRLLPFLRMVCNDFIGQCCGFCDSASVFDVEPSEAITRLTECLEVAHKFQKDFYHYKQLSQEQCPYTPWNIPNALLWHRLDIFMERCKDGRSLIETLTNFERLERIEIGGTQGKLLSESIQELFLGFKEALKIFEGITYDIFDINDKSFDQDFDVFSKWVNEAEEQIGSIITQALAEMVSVEAAFKLLDSFEGVIERPAIQMTLERHYLALLEEYNTDLKSVVRTFIDNQEDPPIYNNMPPYSGALTWSMGLQRRATTPMAKFRQCSKVLLESDEMAEAEATHSHILELLHSYNNQKQKDWAKEVDESVVSKLKLPLLIMADEGPDKGLQVNFDPSLVRMLREVGYFLKLNLDVPDTAMSIFKKAETFRNQTGNLEVMATKYNWIQANMLAVEKPLVANELKDINHFLERGTSELNWKSMGINEFVSEASSMVKGVEHVLLTLKDNVVKIQNLLHDFTKSMVERTDSGCCEIEMLQEAVDTTLNERQDLFQEVGDNIHQIVQTSNKTVRTNKAASTWKDYVSYLNNIVMDKLVEVVANSLERLSQLIDSDYIKQHDMSPLIQISLELEMRGSDPGGNVIFTPDLNNKNNRLNLRDFIVNWMCEFHKFPAGMKRLCTGNGDYSCELESRIRLRDMVEDVIMLIGANEESCECFADTFRKYSDLWTLDLQEQFNLWWQETAVVPESAKDAPEEGAEEGAEDAKDKAEPSEEELLALTALKIPPLAAFEARIVEYTTVRDECNMLPTNSSVGWLRIDSKPVRQQVLYWVEQWVSLYTDFLRNKIEDSMEEMQNFMCAALRALAQQVSEEDESSLRAMLETIRDVKKNTKRFDTMVDPLKEYTQLLKRFGIIIPEGTINAMEEAPDKWDSVKHNMFEVKEKLNDLYNREGDKLKRRTLDFGKEVTNFRQEFQANAPFKYAVGPMAAYITMEEQQGHIKTFQQRTSELQEAQMLYELVPSQYKELTDSSKELSLLKTCWDMGQMIVYCFEDWRSLLWDSIDTEYLMGEAKKLKDQVRRLDKKVRIWDTYKGIDDECNNMMVSLPLIQQLKSPSMRQRHWKELMLVTGTSFTLDSSFCLADLIALELHLFEEDVEGVVIKSSKELTIEKNIVKIEGIWESLEMIYDPYPKDDTVQMMKVPEEMVDAREEHQVALQAMQASKYIKVFEEQVNSWLGKLGTVEAVCTVWQSVQEKWMQLESIFIGSEDIRAQLPEDSKRFDTIDEDWRSLMNESCSVPNAVQVCNREGQLEKLEKMEEMLDLCQKALDEYLGTKRTAFPRFYFVAPADLLDILSKGSNPLDIQHHFSKCFDNLEKLEFDKDEVATGKAFHADGMYSSEKEYVPFVEVFDATGQAVENYLQALVEHQCKTLKDILQEAISAYSADTRHQWQFEHCCQIVLVTTMIWWATEVTQAFNALEDGMETALKDQWQAQVDALKNLSVLVRGELSKGDRRKIVTLMTIDVHARDVVNKMVIKKTESAQSFDWLAQLRLYWDDQIEDCLCDCCDARFLYGYEYVGNCGRLVITPLTDRCYITLTQALRLKMGGAPAGPAGTGKTETTKDLGRALGIIVYVFNCSPQMNSGVMANIFKGLAASGAWGCFDEFNRIPIETLSVVATQFRSVLVGIRAHKEYPAVHHVVSKFMFDGEECDLVPCNMNYITMNPGYAGRTELPENVKALYRSCAMIVPDIEMICEIMLFSEGFEEAKLLSRKFMLLFRLNKDLLSIQVHYDWGLRAVKSILVIAGALKRADPDVLEDGVLMRALRDCNVPKLVSDDVEVFLGVVTDIFPGMDLPRRRDESLEKLCREACANQGLQPEDNFISKISALKELFEVRHSVFVLGPSGSGKSCAWHVLEDAQTRGGIKTVYEVINPKAQTSNEMYGYIHPVMGWKDGIFSFVMRNFSQQQNENMKWIVFDGDVDPDWIESLNTVMDDNKMLTLASNERVPLNPTMRLLLEVADLRNASPATVSRGGVLMLNETDVGWRPMVDSWLQNRVNKSEVQLLSTFINDYLPCSLEYMRRHCKTITAVVEINMVTSVFHILLDMLSPEDEKKDWAKEHLELRFVFACVWGLGSALSVDKGIDYRKQFSDWWKMQWQVVPFPEVQDEGGNPIKTSVYDFFVDNTNHVFKRWVEVVPKYVHSTEVPFYSIVVPTAETTALTAVMTMLSNHANHVQFVGLAGTAKSTLVKEKLRALDEDWSSCTLFMNSKTNEFDLQLSMEGFMEKRAGKTYTPIGNKKHIFFFDDLNMPSFDKWGTQCPLELLIQLLSTQFFYDRNKIGVVKDIRNCQYIGAMNPTAGSFAVSTRLQRMFMCFACGLPSDDSIEQIYANILSGVLGNFNQDVQGMSSCLVSATIALHNVMLKFFLPNAIKFHYTWNLRELANIFQGIAEASPIYYVTPNAMARLWVHEATRVYGDRLMFDSDIELFVDKRKDTCAKFLENVDLEEVLREPLVFASFCAGEDPVYLPVPDFEKLNTVLTEKLNEYNESNAAMNLVLFEMFMTHVCRLTRILDKGRGNAMLVGVGGSGKQSLTKLGAFIGQFSTFSLQLTGSYNVSNLREDMLGLYMKCGAKGEDFVWLLTDAQIVDDAFLVYINDYLSSGNIPELFTPEDKSDALNSVRSEVKAEGLIDTNDVCWEFFIDKVRKKLHVVFCMSPVGDKMRQWCRKFPALINCSVIDWVHCWPEEALRSVAMRFIGDLDFGSEPGLHERISVHMAFVHTQSIVMCSEYLAEERRYNYATPKSFLEFIDLYKQLLGKKRGDIEKEAGALEIGLQKLLQTEEDVGQLKLRLEEEAVFVADKTEKTEKLLVVVGSETEIVNEQKALAALEEEKANVEREAATKVQAECDFELGKAEPLVKEALAALDTLNKDAIGELKGFNNPPKGIPEVCECVLYMLSPEGKLVKNADFKAAKKAMSDPGGFVSTLKSMDIDNIPRPNIAKVKQSMDKHGMHVGGENAPDVVLGRSLAAGGLASWVLNIVKYDDCYQMITPLRNNLAGALEALGAAEANLAEVMANVAALEAKLGKLTEQFEVATTELNELTTNAEKTQNMIVMAERLVGGLSDEKVRWTENVKNMKTIADQMIGDTLLASAFVSYIGAFSSQFRDRLEKEIWMPDLMERTIPCTNSLDPLMILADPAIKASWSNEGLPADILSVQNAAIITSCARWPLMIDPQLQGGTWIKNREAENEMKTITQSGKFLDNVERAISMGNPLLIENLPENIDAVLEPVLSRAIIKRGGMTFIKLGDKDDVEYDQNFRLYLQTKMPNPHYQPEVAAQTTLINFTVTEKGLEDQLLAVVVQFERPDLEESMQGLVRQSNEFTQLLKELADSLLFKLSNAEGNLIEDIELIEGLEKTKATSVEVSEKQVEGAKKEAEIGISREAYRPAAARSSLIYFVLNQLWIIDHMYQYSLSGFMRVFQKSIERAETSENVATRVKNVLDNVTLTLFQYASRGLFARHKMCFSAQLCFKIMRQNGDLDEEAFEWLHRCPKTRTEKPAELDWMSDGAWYAAQSLSKIAGFESLPNDLVSSSKRWKEWCDLEASEKEKFPMEYKNLTPLQRLCLTRCLRPDRMTMATEDFVVEYMGKVFVTDVPAVLEQVLPESDPATPCYYILSPGVDVVGEVERAAKERGLSVEDGTISDVSLGEGQDVISDREVDRQCKEGGWVILQNVHLMPRWLLELEKRIERNSPDAHPDFRLFLTSDPSANIPVALLQRSLKLTQEPPPGLKALFLRSWKGFDDNTWDASSKQTEMKVTLFALSFFHAVMVERIKFGPQGWNRKYPFNVGDLTCCKEILFNYLESSGTAIPWDDLRYIFGEIMYGGHITDHFDRLLCETYLKKLMNNDLFEGMELYPGFTSAPNTTHTKLVEYIEEHVVTESPIMFGMHPNAEIGFRTDQSNTMYTIISDLQPKGASGGGGSGGASVNDRVMGLIEEINEKLNESHIDMEDLVQRIDDEGGRTPFINVFYQESVYMNALTFEITKSLEVLTLGLNGELQMSESMEALSEALFGGKVPVSWAKLAFASMKPLAGWLDNLMGRLKQIQDWAADLGMPKVAWISGFFNPQSFLTAILQSQARKNEWPLDKVVVACEVTKKMTVGEIDTHSREGSYTNGFTMEGARWDNGIGAVSPSLPKEMFCPMPVVLIKAVPVDKADFKDCFMCPVYKVQQRGHTYVFQANLKTRQAPADWIMGGVALIMDIVM
eukprot:TRINITY_DN1972_c0_g1_i10.p1 TRINITY_DN1972_c0_g1~~TRINITY_DN1972_c0_g1_i10.p1  ORF type:complete len:4525 (-),score=1414.93 TRINITY_DN1972_c0_g1_i10:97-13671(-)